MFGQNIFAQSGTCKTAGALDRDLVEVQPVHLSYHENVPTWSNPLTLLELSSLLFTHTSSSTSFTLLRVKTMVLCKLQAREDLPKLK